VEKAKYINFQGRRCYGMDREGAKIFSIKRTRGENGGCHGGDKSKGVILVSMADIDGH